MVVKILRTVVSHGVSGANITGFVFFSQQVRELRTTGSSVSTTGSIVSVTVRVRVRSHEISILLAVGTSVLLLSELVIFPSVVL